MGTVQLENTGLRRYSVPSSELAARLRMVSSGKPYLVPCMQRSCRVILQRAVAERCQKVLLLQRALPRRAKGRCAVLRARCQGANGACLTPFLNW